jgi:hypothetical protein
MPDKTIRLTTSLAGERQYWRPGEKYTCSEKEANLRLQRGEAIEYIEGEADYIPPDGIEAHVIVNKQVREQSTAVQPKRRTA